MGDLSQNRGQVDYSNRKLTRVPRELLEQEDIQLLTLRNNQLEILPVELFHQLRSLTWLDLRKNQLEEIPVEIGMLQDLRCLLLNDNLLISLPNELSFCESLVGLHLAGNPIQYPPEAVWRKGCAAILSFLRLHQQNSNHDLYDEPSKTNNQTEPFPKKGQSPSQYDLWGKSFKPRKVSSSAAVSAARKPSRLQLAAKSSAFLDSDCRIKLRKPHLPTTKDITAKGELLKAQKAERGFKTNVTKTLEERRRIEKDQQWRTETRKRQMEMDRIIQGGDIEILPVEVPYGRLGDEMPQVRTRKRPEGQTAPSVYSLSELRSGKEVSDIRSQIRNLVQKMNLEQNDASKLTDSGETLARAEDYISSLHKMSRLLIG
ncbi:hypothetical protein RvY_10505 [Ramazzottius varieornatus]|uniref:Leucine-rich repeat-containing protein 27 n=1 Tax=Ramazzottius varieornatus TaxID=947166 RepID=A0A1D1VKR2_RAMVA|nr:hypothetical protein RvY_10505 [Ramazzottius varieornatus]